MPFLGEILVELRDERGLTQMELARELNTSNSTISAYESGSRMPPADMLIKMSQFFDVTTDYLLGLTKSRVPPSLMNREIYDGVSVYEFIKAVSGLLPDQKRAVMVTLKSMCFYSEMTGHSGKSWTKEK